MERSEDVNRVHRTLRTSNIDGGQSTVVMDMSSRQLKLSILRR
jgi:hypothetical protein